LHSLALNGLVQGVVFATLDLRAWLVLACKCQRKCDLHRVKHCFFFLYLISSLISALLSKNVSVLFVISATNLNFIQSFLAANSDYKFNRFFIVNKLFYCLSQVLLLLSILHFNETIIKFPSLLSNA